MAFAVKLIKVLMQIFVFTLFFIILPGVPPQTTFPYKKFSVSPPQNLAKLEINHYLENAEQLFVNKISGPETLIARNNEIYMGLNDGQVVKVTGKHVTHVVKFGQPCAGSYEESICGRPLGLAFDTIGDNIIVADAYYGLWSYGLKTQKKQLLVPAKLVLAGKKINRPAKIFNGVAVAKNGDIYWTDSSSDFGFEDTVFASLANPSGRLFKYVREKNESYTLLDNLFFANGLALSPNEDFIVVAELGANRLIKYYLSGPNAYKSEMFVDALPGLPDNITPDADGMWIALIMTADSSNPSGFTIFSEMPLIRKFFSRLLMAFELLFRALNRIAPNYISKYAVHFIGSGDSVLLLAPQRSTVVRVDWNGNIIGSLHGFDKSVFGISHVLDYKNYLYFGSPSNKYLTRIPKPEYIQTWKGKSVETGKSQRTHTEL